MEILSLLIFLVYMTASLGLLIFGLNCYVMLGFFRRCFHRGRATQASLEEAFQQRVAREGDAFLPVITTQIALFNEMNVAERVLRACAAMEYPADRHEIQVLDDSNDETIALVDRVAAELREEGHDIQVIRRAIREGYKAGALGDGLEVARGEFVAIFDSDFVPPKDFLLRALPHLLEDPGIGLAQGRWGHLNAEDSLLTRAQALGVDGHFAIEQSARAWNHLFLNFNGTAGLWRKQAIQDAGGWQSDTLTEDMDLSYRSQLAGWRLEYVPDLVVPAELPSTFTAFKSQQFRWAKGSIQTARKVLPKVFAARVPLIKKIQSIFHLTHYLVHPLMLTVSLLALPLLLTKGGELVPTFFFILLAIPLIPATLAPSLLYLVSQRTLYPRSWLQRAALIPGLMVVGFGICLSNSRAVWEALSGKKSGFIRTPKAGEKRLKNYRAGSSIAPALETMLGLYCTATFVLYVGFGQVWIAPFLLLYAAGFLLVGSASLRESLIG